ncbi:hypothetical protein [Stieleria varia]|uniref:Uncharacterized protein n=1 Tax=Stieleria varia TaxID=2528005 RepID=A0A5C5ZXK9_9BACT|nr:hypothetical protein [Stieleria varia]TWT91999.1 hypothetical protein Pla52n_64720 [Stieleria varia]
MNHLEYYEAPYRPQFGQLKTSCDARTPTLSLPLLAVVTSVLTVLAPLSLWLLAKVCIAWMAQAPDRPVIGLIGMGVVCIVFFVVAFLVLRFVRRCVRSVYLSSRLSVYESGLHLVYEIRYTIQNPHWIQFMKGIRQVSRSFQFIESVRVCEVRKKGRDFLQADIKFTDGESVCVHSADGEGTLEAIESIVKSAGDKAVVNLKANA